MFPLTSMQSDFVFPPAACHYTKLLSFQYLLCVSLFAQLLLYLHV